ncbi:MAG: hypothetical protein H2172_11635 [Opitutus sp.]|nr:hypothetical protein [Opitutus sp.]MCS6276999.1 hypothetical protein [Opitutus sp.]MCS6299953.1 hypothetical protein [Opitutus sp.]
MKEIEVLQEQLLKLSPKKRKLVLSALPRHQLEVEFDINAEIILDAISRSSDLTKRGVRGIIAESVFIKEVLPEQLENTDWRLSDVSATDLPYDALIENSLGMKVSIQVKNQRVEKGSVKIKNGNWIVEVQKTRSGKGADGQSTRPYKFTDFHLIAVCLWPGTRDWRKFAYCLTQNLVPRRGSKELIEIMQPIPTAINEGHWNSSLTGLLRSFEI